MKGVEGLNSREQAFTVWLVFVIVIFSVLPSLRKDFLPILSSLVSKSFLKLYLVFLGYGTLMVAFLRWIRVWEVELVKDTLIWMIFAGLPLMYRAARSKNLLAYFEEMIRSLLTLTVVLEFLMGLHTFAFWKEFLLVPVFLFLVLLLAFAKERESGQRVVELIERFILVLMIAFIAAEFFYVFGHLNDFLKWDYFWQFWLPVELSILLIPFIYGTVLFMRLEDTLSVVAIRKMPNRLKLFCKIALPFYFYNDPEGLVRWRASIFRTNPKSVKDITNTIRNLKQLQLVERNPPLINIADGWSPYVAKDFMKGMGLITVYYQNHYREEWGCSSNTKHFDNDDWLANSVQYTVNGAKEIATELVLELQVFDIKKLSDGHEVFLAHIFYLVDSVLVDGLPLEVSRSVLLGKGLDLDAEGFRLRLSRSDFGNIYSGYYLKFRVRHPKHVVDIEEVWE